MGLVVYLMFPLMFLYSVISLSPVAIVQFFLFGSNYYIYNWTVAGRVRRLLSESVIDEIETLFLLLEKMEGLTLSPEQLTIQKEFIARANELITSLENEIGDK